MDYPKRLRASNFDVIVSGKSVQVYNRSPDHLNILQINGQLENPKKAWPEGVQRDLGGNCCCYSPTTGKFFAIGHSDQPVISIYDPKEALLLGRYVYSSKDVKRKEKLCKNVGGIQCMQFSKCERYLYFSPVQSENGIVHLNTIVMTAGGTAPSECSSVRLAHKSPINHLTLSPNGKFLASSSTDGTILIWDVSCPVPKEDKTNKENDGDDDDDGKDRKDNKKDKDKDNKKKVVVAANKSKAAAAASPLDPRSPPPEAFASPLDPALGSPDAAALDAVVMMSPPAGSPTGGFGDLAHSTKALFKLHNGDNAKSPRPFRRLAVGTSTNARVLKSVFSSDGKTLFSVSTGEWYVRAWDPEKGVECRPPLRVSAGGYFTSMALSPDDGLLVVSSRDKSLRFVDVEKWEVMENKALLDAHPGPIRDVLFPPSFETVHGSEAAAVALSKNHSRHSRASLSPFPYFLFSICDEGRLKIWNLNRKQTVFDERFPGSELPKGMAFSPSSTSANIVGFLLARKAKCIFFAYSYGAKCIGDHTWKHPLGKKIVKFGFDKDLSNLKVQEEGLEAKVLTIPVKKAAIKVANDEVLFLPEAKPFGYVASDNNNKDTDKDKNDKDAKAKKQPAVFDDRLSASNAYGGVVGGESSDVEANSKKKSNPAAGVVKASTADDARRLSGSTTRALEEALARAVSTNGDHYSPGMGDRTSSSSSSAGSVDSYVAFLREFDKKAKAIDQAVQSKPINSKIEDGGDDNDGESMEGAARRMKAGAKEEQTTIVIQIPAAKAFGEE